MAKGTVNKRKIPCPVCGSDMIHVRLFNEDVMGTKNNPYIGWICQNPNCQGWWCDCCEEWHSYGTSCGVAMVRNVRGDHYLAHDPNWRHSENRVQGERKK